MIRNVEQWIELFYGKTSREAAIMVLGDLVHYYHGRGYEGQDIVQLSNALLAFAVAQDGDRNK